MVAYPHRRSYLSNLQQQQREVNADILGSRANIHNMYQRPEVSHVRHVRSVRSIQAPIDPSVNAHLCQRLKNLRSILFSDKFDEILKKFSLSK